MRKSFIAALILLASLAPCFVLQVQGSAPLTIVTSSLPTATANTPYSAPVQATGGTPPYKWSVTNASLKGGLPAGIGLKSGASPGSSMLGGTTSQQGAFPFLLVVTDNARHVVQKLLTLTVQPQQHPAFTLSVSPLSLTLPQGNQGSSRVTTSISGGFNSAISLSNSGQPAGVTVSFSPNPIPAPGAGNSTMAINIASTTPAGAYPITITANGGGLRQSTTLTLTVTATPGAGGQPLPAPPATYIDTTWNPPNGRTWNAHSATDFQNDLNAASPGDTIVLDAGATYSGNFTLPVKSNPSNKWIYIETSAVNSLPLPGTRITPALRSLMPTITTPNTTASLAPAPGANHYRLVGLEITSKSTQGGNSSNNPPSNNFTWCLICYVPGIGVTLPDSITIDRSYIHGSDTQDVGQGVQCNFSNCAVIDSYISDIHESTFDSQAILAYWTPGPLKIVNNYLSSGGEDTMIGGAGDYNNPYVPSDIEIRHNTFDNPLTWEICGVHGTVPNGALLANGTQCHVNNQWIIKNNLEFKSARRVLVTGNTFQNTWLSAQTGFSLLLTVRTSQSGNIAVVDDINIESNLFQNVDAGFSLIEQDNLCGAQYGYPHCTNAGETRRTRFANNLLLLRPALDTYQHIAWKMDGGDPTHPGQTDYILDHNTALMSDQSTMWSAIYFSLPQLPWGCTPPQGFSATHNGWIINNALTQQPDGDCAFVYASGVTGLGWYMGDPSPLAPRFFGNALFAPNGRAYSYPPDNDVVTTRFSYVNSGAGDYQLQTPDWTDTTDGKVAGIDWSALQRALNP